MTTLLVRSSQDHDRAATAFGGRPLVCADRPFAWPCCKTCTTPMQYLGRLHVAASAGRDAHLILLFMCAAQPGLCDEWDADGGGNAAIVIPATRLTALQTLPDGASTLPIRYAAETYPTIHADYDAARQAWASATERPTRDVLGQVDGTPEWIQGDETPRCSACGERMEFVAQLEQGPDAGHEMNFGGGCAYVFECGCKARQARLLWQC